MAERALSDIHLRDPFILPVPEEGRYYLYGTDGGRAFGPGAGFPCYVSRDLRSWEGPRNVFAPPPGFWADRDFWAPEVHRYRGRYYLFASFKAEGRRRATQIFVADRPEGPFVPHGDGPVTPPEWECLDGTLWVEPDGAPWLVFCHEWLQCKNGEMCARPLAPDLSAAAGEPVLLFRAGDAPGVRPHTHDAEGNDRAPGTPCYVTDGPFLYRDAAGILCLMWASFGEQGYRQLLARSRSGIRGPWECLPDPLFAADGGHGMIFRDFDGGMRLVLHRPNKQPLERPVLLPFAL